MKYTTRLNLVASRLRTRGLQVNEVPGWQNRGHGDLASISCIVLHHTAGPARGDMPSLATVRDGRPDLAGPLAQFGVGRTGAIYLIAAGLCYHAGQVRAGWMDNSNSVGIEAENTGTGEAWSEALMSSYIALVQELQREFSVPTERVLGHKEVCSPLGRKSDPSFDVNVFRTRLGKDSDMPLNSDDKTAIRSIVQDEVRGLFDTLTPGKAGVKFDGDVWALLTTLRDRQVGYGTRIEDIQKTVTDNKVSVAALADALKPVVTEALASARGATADEIANAVADKVAKRLAQ